MELYPQILPDIQAWCQHLQALGFSHIPEQGGRRTAKRSRLGRRSENHPGSGHSIQKSTVAWYMVHALEVPPWIWMYTGMTFLYRTLFRTCAAMLMTSMADEEERGRRLFTKQAMRSLLRPCLAQLTLSERTRRTDRHR